MDPGIAAVRRVERSLKGVPWGGELMAEVPGRKAPEPPEMGVLDF